MTSNPGEDFARRPHHGGEAAKRWLTDLHQGDKPAKGELVLGGRTVDLRQITMPVLNLYAEADHVIPPLTSRALGRKLGTDHYTELGLPGAHSGMFVSIKSRGIVGKGVVDWLSRRDS
jgi:polyhydroxyalkanoate synthase subunit PhaC